MSNSNENISVNCGVNNSLSSISSAAEWTTSSIHTASDSSTTAFEHFDNLSLDFIQGQESYTDTPRSENSVFSLDENQIEEEKRDTFSTSLNFRENKLHCASRPHQLLPMALTSDSLALEKHDQVSHICCIPEDVQPAPNLSRLVLSESIEKSCQ